MPSTMHRVSIILVFCLFAILNMAVPFDETLSEEDLKKVAFGEMDAPIDRRNSLEARDPDCEKNTVFDVIQNTSEVAVCAADPECKKKMDEDRGEPRTYCVETGVPESKGFIPQGSAHYWNVFIKAKEGDNVLCKCLKGEIKKQSGCLAMTEWECTNDPVTRETAATFFQSIFCDAQHMVTAIETRTQPKLPASCINVGSDGPGLGKGVDAAVAGLMMLLGGAISKGKHP